MSGGLATQLRNIILESQEMAVRSVDFQRVLMYWQIGRVILEEEQQGKERAGYGEFLIKAISGEFQP